ncbi:MAG: 3-deoxy-manno-octulosonate cytidylyltransferase [Verrucomicrobiota bacterium]|nr:3-deoxy-manno-octulosonate cytidylyltransferase [Verrucomicrobiota bacterium]
MTPVPLAIIVPARLGSTRFPRKLLHPIHGRALILRTAERIRDQSPEYPLHFAVAEDELAQVLQAEGFSTVMTDPALPSGTDRLAAANLRIHATAVINVQADEPLVTRRQIHTLAELILTGRADMATLVTRFRTPAEFHNPNRVKAILAGDGRALYFSRAPIPYPRDLRGQATPQWLAEQQCYLHLGMYAYTAQFLRTFRTLAPGKLEQIEKLEQLRALENGFTILAGETDEPTQGVDTLEDADALERLQGA